MLKKGIHGMRKIGIRVRLMLAFILLPLCILIICFYFYYSYSRNMIVEKNMQAAQQTVAMTEEIFELKMSRLSEQMEHVTASSYTRNYLYYPNDATLRQTFIDSIHDYNLLDSRQGLKLLDASGNLLYEEGSLQDIQLKDYRQKVKQAKSGNFWYYNKKNHNVLLAREIRDLYNNTLGYLFSGFRLQDFAGSLMETQGEKNLLFVVDEQGNYLFGERDTSKASVHIDLHKETMRRGLYSYRIRSKSIKDTPWHVVYLVEESYMLEEINNFRNVLLLYGLMFMLVLAGIVFLVYHSIYDPIHQILISMKEVDETDLSKHHVQDEGRDEMHELSVNFNALLTRVEELLHTVQVEQEQKRETQFQLLQAQINPHFLFNTLNTLHYLAILNEDKPVSEGITALAKLLRNTIVDSNEVVSLAEEIENLKNYIIIQKLRFGDLFETVYNIDKDVESCRILKFLLQPIVENSILHAFEEDREHQLLTIRAQKEDDYLKIEIGDNGKGFAMGQDVHSTRKLSGIGIVNIQERIKLMYGERYSMNIQSALGKGTIVTLLLPYESIS